MGLPQRDGRPALDLTPDETPNNAGWDKHFNDPMNTLNKPVAERSGGPVANGWTKETVLVNDCVEVDE